MRSWRIALLLILLAGPAVWVGADDVAATDSSAWGWYVVRPGDTIEGLTIRYLGSRDRWQENYELNTTEIENPNRIEPGQHIKLLLPERLPEGALLRRVANRVEDQPTPLAWTDAREGELLRSHDGVKTYENASALLEFPDGTFLALTEESLVFLRDESITEAEVDRTQIEVVVGQADLSVDASGPVSEQFEIVLGDARATPQPDESGALSTRARRPEGGGAQLMVYSGRSDLEAAGAKVEVATGMGSNVPEGEPPKPPEKLLPAPESIRPAAAARLATPRPTFDWQEVAGARDYTVEICRDEACGSLVERVLAVAETSWQPAGLPVERLFWRVTAVSASGLDGYPTDATAFEILTDVEDTTPPEVRIGFSGPRVAPRFGLNDRWIVGPGMEIEVEVADEGSGIEHWSPMIDGEEIAAEGLKGPWQKGEHSVTVVAVDRAGNEQRVEVPFTYDPDPPELAWGMEGDPVALGETRGDPGEELTGPAPSLRGRREVRMAKHRWFLDSDLRHVILRRQYGKPVGLAGLGDIGRDHGLWVRAEDDVCDDLGNLSYQLESGSRKGEFVLWVEATDCVGNTRRAELPLVRP